MSMNVSLVAVLVLLPMAAAALCGLARHAALRSALVLITGSALVAAALLLAQRVPLVGVLPGVAGKLVNGAIEAADALLLVLIAVIGVRRSHRPIVLLALGQLILFGVAAVSGNPPETGAVPYRCDGLALILVLIVTVVGSVICWQAVAYMQAHEAHQEPVVSRQSRFFAVMFLFLGAMNGLALADHLSHITFFFEATTLCSYLLIAHDGTPAAFSRALRALWMNSLGGLALMGAVVWIFTVNRTVQLSAFIHGDAAAGARMLPLALICIAGFVKAAQFPFQSWLLGAMVAPTPVSALLHSSTMVKAGVYLVLRVVPALQGTFMGLCVVLVGAFSFLAAAALAVGQRNGKRVLAYSTVSNLGLMFACAGLNQPAAYAAAVFLIVFHAVTKAQLFLCVGAIEQCIESRDIEDMRGLCTRMPVTAIITVMGVITMIMPPFGLLVGKWMAMEAAARNPAVLMLLALGSALTVMYWARWAGTLMSDPLARPTRPEKQPLPTWTALLGLTGGAVLLSVAAPWLYEILVHSAGYGYPVSYTVRGGILVNPAGSFAVFPLCLAAGTGFVLAVLAVRHALHARVVSPYLSGAQRTEAGMFTGPMNRPVRADAGNYYFQTIFGENRLTPWINAASILLLVLMVGGALL